jgi:chitin disaccharide deacetylase
MKAVVINADDYGYSAGIDEAILDLALKGVVTATTALVCSPLWPESAKALRDAPLSAGLHLDFTNAFAPTNAGQAASIKQVIWRCWSRSLKAQQAASSIREQLDRYEQAMGRAPEIVDGHEHVHQFPVIREALLEELAHRYSTTTQKPILRSTAPCAWRGAKAAIIGALGSAALRRKAEGAGFTMSGDFAGVYDFAPQADLAALWRTWLDSLSADTGIRIIMCHPKYAHNEHYTNNSIDVITQAREREAQWLGSADFKRLCELCGVTLVRLNATSQS